MTGKTINRGGREGHDKPDLPKPKNVTTFLFESPSTRQPKVTAFEGLGTRGDITAIGKMPDKLAPRDNIIVFLHGGRRFISCHEQLHVKAACLIFEYVKNKSAGLLGGTAPAGAVYESARPSYDFFRETANDSTRILVEMDGPDKTFVIDGRASDPKARKAASLLTDLGISKSNIKYDPGKFKQKVSI